MKGIPEESMEVVIASLAETTQKQYEKPIRLWWQYCQDINVPMFNASVTNVLAFLTKLLDNVGSYGTLNSYRSALSLISLVDLGTDPRIKRFFKGVSILKPQKAKYNETWEPATVISYLKTLWPNKDLSLERLSQKLVTLLAIVTAQRVQTLSRVCLNNIMKMRDKIEIRITERVKTSGRNRPQPCLCMPFFPDQPEVCVARTLIDYLDATMNLRNPLEKHLFITYRKPHRVATTQTLARWIKTTLARGGIDIERFSAHSTRHASTSAACRKGITLDVIRQTAGWSEDSNVFMRFYNRPLSDNSVFARTILEGA